jgi:transposase InsO family protein
MFREAVLNANWLMSLQEVRDIADAWMEGYNTISPHEVLRGLTPYQYERIKS